ncbi:lamin tail domain-containing protein [Specibacter sp. NPDC078709]|uniref:lamin tail domain-containing protein n=1 Tax=Specibacter sp. NPDC078709 TaxID=3154364 RepID=UPI003412BCA5
MRNKQWRLRTAVGLATLAMAGSGVAVALPAVADTPNTVRINEVIQNNDTIADGVELINTGQQAVDVSGWHISDNKPENVINLPAGSIIAPGGYLMVTVDDDTAPVKFGFGKEDEAKLLGPDGTTVVDSFAWSGHLSTSYARCSDGTGTFAVSPQATPGAANICTAPVAGNLVINEIESSGGEPGDWIELLNKSAVEIELGGLSVRDSDDSHVYTLPATVVAPGAFMVLNEAEFGFGLGASDSVRLFDTDGATLIDSHTWTAHSPTSLGRCADGTGDFATTATATKGAANDCVAVATPAILVNEVESSNGNPGDWIELFNAGTTVVDLSAWVVRDNDDSASHAAVLPDGASIAPGGFYVVEENMLGYGLGKADSARIYLPGGQVLVDSYSWTAWGNDEHAPTTFGRCADGTDNWAVTTTSTKGAPNDCGLPIRINEIESDGGVSGDWVELTNIGATPVDISGFLIRDDSEKAPFAVPAGTTLGAGAYIALDVDTAFGLGKADAVRLSDATDTQIDAHSYKAHAATTWGRCPNGTGEFVQTREATKGAANACEGDLITAVWPGSDAVATADVANTFGADMSGLAFEPQATAGAGTLWAVNNGAGSLHRLVQSGEDWVEQGNDVWAGITTLRYADGAGEVDAEGVAMTSAGPSAGIFVASERNNAASGVSRPSILRYDALGGADTLAATAEWNLVEDLPVIGANAGLEGIAWIPDTQLVAQGFVDESTATAYNPASYPNHGAGLFFVAVEANGMIYAYALDQDGSGYTRVATIESGFPGVMELELDPATGLLWAICDDTCEGRSATLEITDSGEGAGNFAVTQVFERPTGMPNLNNEGFAIAPAVFCVDGFKPVAYSDDGQTDGHALRTGTMNCATTTVPEVPGAGEAVDGEPSPSKSPQGTDVQQPSQNAADKQASGSSQDLAQTGANGAGLLGGAALLLLGGMTALVFANRRRLSNH